MTKVSQEVRPFPPSVPRLPQALVPSRIRELENLALPIADLLADYTSHLRLKTLSGSIVKEYRHILRVLFRFLDLQPNQASTLSTTQIRRYVSSLQERGVVTYREGGCVWTTYPRLPIV